MLAATPPAIAVKTRPSFSTSGSAGRIRRLGGVDRDEVALGEQFRKGDELYADLRGPGRRDVGVVGDQAGAEGRESLGDQDADPTQADHADRLVGDLDTGEGGPLP